AEQLVQQAIPENANVDARVRAATVAAEHPDRELLRTDARDGRDRLAPTRQVQRMATAREERLVPRADGGAAAEAPPRGTRLEPAVRSKVVEVVVAPRREDLRAARRTVPSDQAAEQAGICRRRAQREPDQAKRRKPPTPHKVLRHSCSSPVQIAAA